MTMTTGGMSRVTTQSANTSGSPAKPRKRTNRKTPQTSVKIMTVSLAVSISASRSRPPACRSDRCRQARAMYRQNTTIAPSAPASVGVAAPV